MGAAAASIRARGLRKLAKIFGWSGTPGKEKSSNAPLPRWLSLTQPSITSQEIAYVVDAAANGWGGGHTYQKRFETKFSEYVKAGHAICTSSGTGALHLALRAMGVGADDEVIVPESTWIATASAVVYCGAKPIFVDVDPQTWCMDPAIVERAITSRTKVILPVHAFGHPANMPAILALACKHGLKVLEDAAVALGATLDGRPCGLFGDAAAFSFQSVKIATTGEGGMLVTSDPRLFERVTLLANHGQADVNVGMVSEIGFNYKMSHLQAAVGLAQIERVEALVEMRRRIFGWYHRRLGDVKGLQLNAEAAGARNTYWLTVVIVDPALGVRPSQIIAGLRDRRIDARPFVWPLSSFPVFASKEAENPVAYRLFRTGLCLPSGHLLTEADVDRVSSSVLELLKNPPPVA
jgi:perosamine synthetase